MDNEITVIIDDKPATDEQIAELFEQYGKSNSFSTDAGAVRAFRKGNTIRHFTWDYAKARAAGLGHV